MIFHFDAQKTKKNPKNNNNKKNTFQFPPLMWGFAGVFFWIWYLEKADLHMYGQTRKKGLCSAEFLESM